MRSTDPVCLKINRADPEICSSSRQQLWAHVGMGTAAEEDHYREHQFCTSTALSSAAAALWHSQRAGNSWALHAFTPPSTPHPGTFQLHLSQISAAPAQSSSSNGPSDNQWVGTAECCLGCGPGLGEKWGERGGGNAAGPSLMEPFVLEISDCLPQG